MSLAALARYGLSRNTSSAPASGVEVIDQTTRTQATLVSSITVNVPSHVDGDLLVLLASARNAWSPPAGWTEVANYSDATSAQSSRVYVRVANSEPASYTISSSNLAGQWIMLSVRGASATPADVDGASDATLTVAQVTVPALSVAADGSLVVYVATVRTTSASFSTPPAEYTLAGNFSGSAGVGSQIAYGAFDTGTAGSHAVVFSSNGFISCAGVVIGPT